MREVTIQDMGDIVICDGCGEEWTKRDDSGGLQVGSNAYCPDCAPQIERDVKQYKEEHTIRARCPAGKPYRKWVLEDLRQGNNKVIIETFPKPRVTTGETLLSIDCKECRKTYSFMVKDQDYRDWENDVKKVQEAFPYLSAEQRELLISRVCGACFEEMFSEE